MTARGPYYDPDTNSMKWISLFIVCSLLAHAIIIAIIVLITVFMPPPKVPELKPQNSITLSLAPPPKPPPLKIPPPPIFVPTQPQANVPHKEQPLQSANDTVLSSRAKVAHNPDSLTPEIDGVKRGDLNNSPAAQGPKPAPPSTTPPTPKQQEKPTPPQPKPQEGTQQPSPKAAKPQPQQPTKPQPQAPAVDPDTGLPVLPPLNVPTMAPPDSSPKPSGSSVPAIAQSTHGAVGTTGDNSPAAMATPLGKYKMQFWAEVSSYWHQDVDRNASLYSVGTVVFKYTVHSDGTISDITLLDGNDANLNLLRDVSRHALMAPAPFKPFSDEIKKQVGDSYTDQMSFSIYTN